MLLRVGRRYPELLASFLPAMQLMQQPSGPISVNLVAGATLYSAFSDRNSPLGLVPTKAKAALRPRRPTSQPPNVRARRMSDNYQMPGGFGRQDSDSSETPLLVQPDPVKELVLFWTSGQPWWLPAPKRSSEYGRPGELTTTYTSSVLPICGDFVRFLEELEHLNGRRTRVNLYDNIHTVCIVHALWTHGAGFMHALLCTCYLALAGLVGAFALLPEGTLPYWLLLACTAPFLLAEAGVLATSHSVRWYWSSAYNWVDWLNYGLLILVGTPTNYDAGLRGVLFAALIVLMSFKVLFFLRAYTTLVNTVLQAILDMGAFALIVLLILISFATARSVLDRRDGDAMRGDDGAAYFPFLELFAFMLGEFDIDEYRVQDAFDARRIALNVLFYVFQVLVSIVLLNLLITILSDSYDLSQERRKAEYMRMRAQLIVEYNRLLPCVLRPKGRWLHVLVSSALLSESIRDFALVDKASDDEWSSRLTTMHATLSHIRKEASSASSRMDSKVDACNARLDRLAAKIDSVITSVHGIVTTQQVVHESHKLPSPPATARMKRLHIQAANT